MVTLSGEATINKTCSCFPSENEGMMMSWCFTYLSAWRQWKNDNERLSSMLHHKVMGRIHFQLDSNPGHCDPKQGMLTTLPPRNHSYEQILSLSNRLLFRKNWVCRKTNRKSQKLCPLYKWWKICLLYPVTLLHFQQ